MPLTFFPPASFFSRVRGHLATSYLAPLAVAPPVEDTSGDTVGVTHNLPAETPKRVRLHPMKASDTDGDDRLRGKQAYRAFMRVGEGVTEATPNGVDAGWRIASNGVEYAVIESNAMQTSPMFERRLIVVRATQ